MSYRPYILIPFHIHIHMADRSSQLLAFYYQLDEGAKEGAVQWWQIP
jgi:hypothetical protein